MRLDVSWTIFVNVESPKLGVPHLNFLGEAQCKKTSCTWQSVIIVWVNQPPLILKYKIMFQCCSSSSYGFADSPLSAASNNKSQQAPSRVYAALRLQWRSDARRKFSESRIAHQTIGQWCLPIIWSLEYPQLPSFCRMRSSKIPSFAGLKHCSPLEWWWCILRKLDCSGRCLL